MKKAFVLPALLLLAACHKTPDTATLDRLVELGKVHPGTNICIDYSSTLIDTLANYHEIASLLDDAGYDCAQVETQRPDHPESDSVLILTRTTDTGVDLLYYDYAVRPRNLSTIAPGIKPDKTTGRIYLRTMKAK